MGFGFFKKIKDGLIKVGKKIATGFKKAVGFVNDKIVQPLAPAISKALMSSGDPKMAAIGAGITTGSAVFANLSNALNKNDVKGAVAAVRDIPGLSEKFNNMSNSELAQKLKPYANMAKALM